jgi:excisionase family DNA binding protein
MQHDFAYDAADEWLTLPPAARELGVSPATMLIMARAREIPTRRVGRFYAIHRRDLDALIAARRARHTES